MGFLARWQTRPSSRTPEVPQSQRPAPEKPLVLPVQRFRSSNHIRRHSGAPPKARLRASATRYGGEPGTITTDREYGFRARGLWPRPGMTNQSLALGLGASGARNTVLGALGRARPAHVVPLWCPGCTNQRRIIGQRGGFALCDPHFAHVPTRAAKMLAQY